MARYKLILEYCGAGTVGWQAQGGAGSDSISSIQALVQDAIFRFCGRRVDVVAAGRTDAGVHALGMAAHFDLEPRADRVQALHPVAIMRALNFWLFKAGAPVAVLDCELVPDDWHARFSCKRRNYKYIILNRCAPAVLDAERAWRIPRKLDIEKMRAAAARLIGSHDFTSFRASECQAKNPVKTLDKVEIVAEKPQTRKEKFSEKDIAGGLMCCGESSESRVGMNAEIITISFSARSFLHHQVRNMVGTLAEIGLGKPHDIDEILAVKNRAAAGPTAPAYGLYFVSAEY
jgi:tRNA pseudouridine38-40 synthase